MLSLFFPHPSIGSKLAVVIVLTVHGISVLRFRFSNISVVPATSIVLNLGHAQLIIAAAASPIAEPSTTLATFRDLRP